MAFTEAGLNSMLNWMKGSTTAGGWITHCALHSGTAVSTSGTAAEISTAGNIYARQAISFNAAAGGLMTSTGSPAFTVPAGATVTAVSFWGSSATNGICLGYTTVPNEVYGSQGSYTLTSATLAITSTT
jgi:hypothetical protein